MSSTSESLINNLHAAIVSKNPEKVQSILAQQPPVNALSSSKQTALHLACVHYHPTICSELIQAGADPTIMDGNGWTPIHYAIHSGNTNALDLLYQKAPYIKNLGLNKGSALIPVEIIKQVFKLDTVSRLENISAITFATLMGQYELAKRLLGYHVALMGKEEYRKNVINDNKKLKYQAPQNSLDGSTTQSLRYDNPQPYSLENYRIYTKNAARNGFVMTDGSQIKITAQSIQSMQKNTKQYSNEEAANLKMQKEYIATEINVLVGDTLDTAKRLKNQGFNPVVLNFAARNLPTGGVDHGGYAQEEYLSFSSNYFQSLIPNENPYLASQLKGQPYDLPEYGGVYSPGVTIFRENGSKRHIYCLPWTVSIIASAAYDWRVGNENTHMSESRYKEGMEKKIRAILKIAAQQGHDCVVLGAFGCGAFRRDERTPIIVAEIFKTVLEDEEFRGVFRHISFPIIDIGNGSGNYEIFAQRLNFKLRDIELEAKQQALVDAVIKKDLKSVIEAQQKLGINTRNIRMQTALHFACMDEYFEPKVLRKLLELGADIRARDENGCTPVHYAAIDNSEALEIIRAFGIEHNKDIGLNDGTARVTPQLFKNLQNKISYTMEEVSPLELLCWTKGIDLGFRNYLQDLKRSIPEFQLPAIEDTDIKTTEELKILFSTHMKEVLKSDRFKAVRQHENQVNVALHGAIGCASCASGGVKLELIRYSFFSMLDELVTKNNEWKASNFAADKRPANHVAKEVAEAAKEVFEESTCQLTQGLQKKKPQF